MKHCSLKRCSLIALEAVVLSGLAYLSGSLGYWLTDRQLPVIVQRIYPANYVVPIGGVLRMYREVFRSRLCLTFIQRSIIDSNNERYELPLVTYRNGSGPLGKDTYSVSHPLPSGIATGLARYVGQACYVCNPTQVWWPICAPLTIVQFKVVAAASPLDTVGSADRE